MGQISQPAGRRLGRAARPAVALPVIHQCRGGGGGQSHLSQVPDLSPKLKKTDKQTTYIF